MGKVVALDIETAGENALIPHLSHITCVGIWCPEFEGVFRDLGKLKEFIEDNPNIEFVGQNFAFDLKHLFRAGIDLRERWVDDTRLMAHTSFDKVPENYLEKYESWRKIENKNLKRGYSHRKAGAQSLKTMAPYFLGVDPFWENPANHDNDEYVLKDCEYTYRLYERFTQKLLKEGTYRFYKDWLMPRAKTVLNAELSGIKLDLKKMARLEAEALTKRDDAKRILDERWAPAYIEHKTVEKRQLLGQYKTLKTLKRKFREVTGEINFNSPKQLQWLFRDYLGLDITDFSEEESTGIEVLEKLSSEGRDDIKSFIEYRKYNKLATAFFPTYRELSDGGIIRPSFNVAGTRTGRLSSSDPNLQQVPGELREMFIARPNYKLITRDQSYIEPRLVAFYTQDPMLIELIQRGGNFHSANAKIMFGLDCPEEEVKDRYPKERGIAKTCGLALMYGAGARRIQMTARKAGIHWELDKCRELYENFKETYQTVFKFKESLDRAARRQPIENLFGRKHSYINCPEDIYMKTFNTLIQSSASDLVIDSAYLCMQAFRDKEIDAQVLLFVHDELCFEVPDKDVKRCEGIIEHVMTGYKLETGSGNLPLEVEGSTGNYWGK